MDVSSFISLASAIGGILAATIAGVLAARTKRTEHSLAQERDQWQASFSEQKKRDEYMRDVVRLAQEPLLYAASDLQSRIYNLLEGSLVEAYAGSDKERHRVNITEYTAFLFAQYFGWAEAVRQGVMLNDMAGVGMGKAAEEEGTVSAIIREISDTMRSDAYGREFMMFAGEQHAVGELMLTWDSSTGTRLPSVTRYASFARRYRNESEFRGWLESIAEGMGCLSDPGVRRRLTKVQNYLVTLMELLDPDNRVYKKRKRLALPVHETTPDRVRQ
jgi:hypothetical protein